MSLVTSRLTTVTTVFALLAITIVAAPSPASAEAATCAGLKGELLPDADACLVDLDLALRPEGYVFRFGTDVAASDPFRQTVADVAAELTEITALPFVVGADYAAGSAPNVGEILVHVHEPVGRCRKGSACAAGERFGWWPWLDGDEIQGGQIYFTTRVDDDSSATRKAVVMHEIGHVLGLQHYDYFVDEQPTHEIMAWNVRSTGVVEWQDGDIAGLQYLADYQRRSPSGPEPTVTPSAGGFFVSGSMDDPSAPGSTSILLEIDNGTPTASTVATTFDAFVGAPIGEHTVCIRFMNVGAGVDSDAGCQDLTITVNSDWWHGLGLSQLLS